MLSPIVAQTEDFARLFFRLIEDSDERGWTAQGELLRRAAASSPEHPYLAYILEKPGARIGFTAIAERIRRAEFGHIERRKAAFRRNAPVHFRLRPEARALVPAQPHEVSAAAKAGAGPDLAMLDRAFAQEREADVAAAGLAGLGARSSLGRAVQAFDWQQPRWPERLSALLRRLHHALSGWFRHGPRAAA